MSGVALGLKIRVEIDGELLIDVEADATCDNSATARHLAATCLEAATSTMRGDTSHTEGP